MARAEKMEMDRADGDMYEKAFSPGWYLQRGLKVNL